MWHISYCKKIYRLAYVKIKQNAGQSRSMEYHLGVGRRIPNVAPWGATGWSFSEQRQYTCMLKQWGRFAIMAEMHMNTTIFKWAYRLVIEGKKNSTKLTMDFYNSIGMNNLTKITNELLCLALLEMT